MSASRARISTHVLDTSKGRPVPNLPVKLYQLKSENLWTLVGEGTTNDNGRVSELVTDDANFVAGTYKLTFLTKKYYDSRGVRTMYPFIDVVFEADKSEHYHVPLLLNAFGYTTYRGS